MVPTAPNGVKVEPCDVSKEERNSGTGLRTCRGFNVTTTNQLSTDFGRTFLLGNPQNGILPIADPFPVRATTGSRYESILGNALGIDTMLGRAFSAENPNRKHARVQRWRLSWQREIASRTALEVAYAGSYADRQGVTFRQDFLPTSINRLV